MNRKYLRQTRKIEADAYRDKVAEKLKVIPVLEMLSEQQFNPSLRRFMGEVLRDTIFYYGRWPNRKRGVSDKSEYCVYYNPITKTKCAVGRMLHDPAAESNFTVAGLSAAGFKKFSKSLKPKYRRLPQKFLAALQMFHDVWDHWNAAELHDICYVTTGITEQGKLFATAILVACGYTTPGAIRAITFWSDQLEQVIAGYKDGTTNHDDTVPQSMQRILGKAPKYIDEFRAQRQKEREDAIASGAGSIAIDISLGEHDKSN